MLHGVKKLKGVVQNYSWGGFDFIPQLLKKKNDSRKPYAEYWLGAHPHHSSLIEEDGISLEQFIHADPSAILGKQAATRFKDLPFLFKVLDVRQMLSIQVHPSKQEAVKGFEEENRKGIPTAATHRNYRDRNHKPELMVALSDFWLLHGFKEKELLVSILKQTTGLSFLLPVLESKGYRGLYEEVMLMPQAKVNQVLEPLAQRIIPLYRQGSLSRDQEDFWAARAIETFCKEGHYDRGIFSIYFFNLLHLKKEEGIFQPEGLPHAYLEGQNVEVMANSDNVLRAGLTEKHIDVPELLKHVHFATTIPKIIRPGSRGHMVYASPAEEFELHRYALDKAKEQIEAGSAEIWFVEEGSFFLTAGSSMILGKGEAVFVPSGCGAMVESEDFSVLYRVALPGGSGKN
jgi:mannose-6-phosphate isomerase